MSWVCIKCELTFDAVRTDTHRSIMCPKCRSGKFVFSSNHPLIGRY